MSTYFEHAPGTICWTDLGTSDYEHAKIFYSSLFGWTPREVEMGPDSFYAIFEKNGKMTAAVYPQSAEARAKGVASSWNTYICVSDVDASAASAEKLGATMVVAPRDITTEGRMAYLQDPSGAMIALWQPKKHIGVQVKGEAGAITWCELVTRDTAAAEKFYTALLGWTAQHTRMPSGEYTLFSLEGRSVAGMMKIPVQWGKTPVDWMQYFAVEDTQTSAYAATALGAGLVVPPTPVPNIGVFATLRDPMGALFSIVDTRA